MNGPLVWTAILGAGEIGLGDEVTTIRSLRKDALAVIGRDSASIMYGNALAVADFVPLLKKTGAVPFTVGQIAGSTIMLDNAGVYFLEASQAFGDFKPNALSRVIKKLVELRGRSAVMALVSRERGQYRIYFDNQQGVTATFHGTKLIGWYPFSLAHQVTCGWQGEDGNGDEVMYAGTEDGYVVQLDSGPSHDGEVMRSLIPLAHSPAGNAKLYKHFFTATPQLTTPQPIDLLLLTEFDFGGTPGDVVEQHTPATGGIWGQAIWGAFFWGAPTVALPVFEFDGTAVYARPIWKHEDDIDEPWQMDAVTIEYEPLGPVR